jgi:hypothetical protein
MKKILTTFFILVLLLFYPVSVIALTSSGAKQNWFDARENSRQAQTEHREAKLAYAADPTPENEQDLIEKGKAVLNAALDEAGAWLTWRNLEVEENPEITDNLKEAIEEDVDANLAKINDLREEVDAVETRLELGIVFLKMIGKYLELLTDVARNTGLVWVHIGNTRADIIEDYEAQLREQAESLQNDEAIEKLDIAKTELETARENINDAESTYNQVVLPGTPLIKFSEGNNYLNSAKGNLVLAHSYLNQAYILLTAGGAS